MQQYYWDFTHLLCWLITSRLSPVRHTLPDWSNTTPIRHTLSDGEASAFIKAGLGCGHPRSDTLSGGYPKHVEQIKSDYFRGLIINHHQLTGSTVTVIEDKKPTSQMFVFNESDASHARMVLPLCYCLSG